MQRPAFAGIGRHEREKTGDFVPIAASTRRGRCRGFDVRVSAFANVLRANVESERHHKPISAVIPPVLIVASSVRRNTPCDGQSRDNSIVLVKEDALMSPSAALKFISPGADRLSLIMR